MNRRTHQALAAMLLASVLLLGCDRAFNAPRHFALGRPSGATDSARTVEGRSDETASIRRKDLRREAEFEGGSVQDRSRFLAVIGLRMSATFALLVVTTFAARYLLSPCD